jgi:hypothetical protein
VTAAISTTPRPSCSIRRAKAPTSTFTGATHVEAGTLHWTHFGANGGYFDLAAQTLYLINRYSDQAFTDADQTGWSGMHHASPYIGIGAQRDLREADAVTIGGTTLNDEIPDTTGGRYQRGLHRQRVLGRRAAPRHALPEIHRGGKERRAGKLRLPHELLKRPRQLLACEDGDRGGAAYGMVAVDGFAPRALAAHSPIEFHRRLRLTVMSRTAAHCARLGDRPSAGWSI